MKLIIQERLPSLNAFLNACKARGHSRRRNDYNSGNAMKQDVQDKISWYIKMSGLVPIGKRVVMHYHWYVPDRLTDKSNIVGFARKAIEDALVNEGILENDGWKHIENFRDYFYVDKEHPRVEVEFEEVK
ncbi:MAG: hypothetical protein FWG40_00785 [Peptococcaceae bacterium]|nr:hypothetical protein [Peptococcaceae bacterium]